jgi:hypothetical protein
MLVCEQCGCSGELGMGWVTVVRADETGEHWMAEYCPTCAAAVLGRGSEAGGRDARASKADRFPRLPDERAAV